MHEMHEKLKNDIVNIYGNTSFGGGGSSSGGGGGWHWDDDLRSWGASTVTTGAGIAGTSLIVTQVDSPLPGPADAVGAGMVLAGAGTAIAGGLAYGIGSIGGLVDSIWN